MGRKSRDKRLRREKREQEQTLGDRLKDEKRGKNSPHSTQIGAKRFRIYYPLQIASNIGLKGSLVFMVLNQDSNFNLPNFPQMSYNEQIGTGLIVLGGLYVFPSAYRLIRNIRKRKLATSNEYGSTRNPMYLGWRILSAGMCVSSPSTRNFAAAAALYLFTEIAARSEEKLLELVYGESYRKYKEKVPRWIPTYIQKPVVKSLEYLTKYLSSRTSSRS